MHQFYSLMKLFPDIYNLDSIVSKEELDHIESTSNGQSNDLLNDVKITQHQIESLFQKPFMNSNITLPKGIAVSNFLFNNQLGIYVLGQINEKGFIYKVTHGQQDKVEKVVELPCVCYANAIIGDKLILSGETQVLIYTFADFKLVKSIDVQMEIHKMIVLLNGSIVLGMTKFTIQIISIDGCEKPCFKLMEDSIILDIIQGEEPEALVVASTNGLRYITLSKDVKQLISTFKYLEKK